MVDTQISALGGWPTVFHEGSPRHRRWKGLRWWPDHRTQKVGRF